MLESDRSQQQQPAIQHQVSPRHSYPRHHPPQSSKSLLLRRRFSLRLSVPNGILLQNLHATATVSRISCLPSSSRNVCYTGFVFDFVFGSKPARISDKSSRDWDKAWSSFKKQGKKTLFSQFSPNKYVTWNPKPSDYPLSEEVDPIKRTERSNLRLWTSPGFTLVGAIVLVSFLLIYTILAPVK
ncbi:hypothetical protein LINGRAHAP2_LOCUS35527 [Linum grandiflorum]